MNIEIHAGQIEYPTLWVHLGLLRTSSSGTRAVYDPSISYGPSENMAYQLTGITLCQVPEGSSVVAVAVRCNETISKSSPNPLALKRNFLGDTGQDICMNPDIVGFMVVRGIPM
ncbi:hypothetical protein K469DRAFT_810532 [Zopfia rhizophila CBS 207.26]|uniref:Uncharacterized protein n=1 Tax=Zopfia rhizophila CBS 207.26 TaxID=1314779 RepID=A0A6A6DHE8_9PEZI|nr:hypothetical protein K469DRAFT_810532 [Zopfia rhizophila CBS 207.26]